MFLYFKSFNLFRLKIIFINKFELKNMFKKVCGKFVIINKIVLWNICV